MSLLQSIAAVCFWLCAAGIFYTYLAYPILVWALSRAFGRTRQCPVGGQPALPFISVLIAAHNEEAIIGERIRNALEFDYPRDRFEVVVASDGSTDSTSAIVAAFDDRRVRLLDYGTRRGKAAVLNAAMADVRGDIVALSDANVFIEPSVLQRFARWFDDKRVGVVCGRLVLSDPVGGNNVDSIYWKYETFLKVSEARLGALLGANGAIYAIRRRLFEPLQLDTLVDDFMLPLSIKLRTGCDIVYDMQSVAYEETPARIASEFTRRSRIGAGGFQSIGRLWRLLLPSSGWIAFTFFSHKVLRWSSPFLLIGMLVSNALLVSYPGYAVALALQAIFYASAALGLIIPPSGNASRVLRLTTLFTGMNLALLVGFRNWAFGAPTGAWQRTARQPVGSRPPQE
jgi:cellulose synthase/poly-beta-1,6-N-acetylglucosamine synthase-like glycosyltransferase